MILLRNDYAVSMTPRYDAQIVLIVKVNSFVSTKQQSGKSVQRDVSTLEMKASSMERRFSIIAAV